MPDKGGLFKSVKGKYQMPTPAKLQQVVITPADRRFLSKYVISFMILLAIVSVWYVFPRGESSVRLALRGAAQKKCNSVLGKGALYRDVASSSW